MFAIKVSVGFGRAVIYTRSDDELASGHELRCIFRAFADINNQFTFSSCIITIRFKLMCSLIFMKSLRVVQIRNDARSVSIRREGIQCGDKFLYSQQSSNRSTFKIKFTFTIA